jgi:hypothetical protein
VAATTHDGRSFSPDTAGIVFAVVVDASPDRSDSNCSGFSASRLIFSDATLQPARCSPPTGSFVVTV